MKWKKPIIYTLGLISTIIPGLNCKTQDTINYDTPRKVSIADVYSQVGQMKEDSWILRNKTLDQIIEQCQEETNPTTTPTEPEPQTIEQEQPQEPYTQPTTTEQETNETTTIPETTIPTQQPIRPSETETQNLTRLLMIEHKSYTFYNQERDQQIRYSFKETNKNELELELEESLHTRGWTILKVKTEIEEGYTGTLYEITFNQKREYQGIKIYTSKAINNYIYVNREGTVTGHGHCEIGGGYLTRFHIHPETSTFTNTENNTEINREQFIEQVDETIINMIRLYAQRQQK